MKLQAQLEEILTDHYSSFDLEPLARVFQDTCYVKIPKFAPPVVETAIKGEVCHMLDNYAVRRDINVKATGNTPRYMEVVSHAKIKSLCQLIPVFYSSPSLLKFLSKIAGEEVLLSPHEGDRFVMTRMTKKGDTHGWHWNDYSYSLVWILETPPPDAGGITEFITDTQWDNTDLDSVKYYLSQGQIQQRSHNVGDVYLLKANTTMHRVSPLKRDALRVILNMGWANNDDLTKESPMKQSSLYYV